jgi:hypothetical protein
MNEVLAGDGQICASNAVMNSRMGAGGSDATHKVHAFEGGTNLSACEPPLFSEILGLAKACGATKFRVRSKRTVR